MDPEDELLRGAIDLHAHGYPEFSLRVRGRVNDIEWAQRARDVGMRAIVIKSHLFPTVERAYLTRKAVPGIEVFGGIVLNANLGGLSPFAVEVAGELGGKVVWMPTWSSRNDLTKSQFYLARMKRVLSKVDQLLPSPQEGITILDSAGKLLPAVKDILGLAKSYGMVVSSGHLSIEESLVLAGEAQKAGVKFMLAHPFSRSVGASIEQQKEIANQGGYIEHCFITTMPMHQRLEPKRIVESIEEIGADRCVISTDATQTWNPPPPEVMRMFIASLLHLGVDERSIRKMVQDNPAQLLGLPPRQEEKGDE